MSDLYDTDILEWSERQAALLRRLAAGERVNDQIDWANVAEEVETVGRNELRAVRSALLQALAHDLKARAWPASREVPHWRAETRRFRIDAAEAFAPSMEPRIKLAELYAKAHKLLPEAIDDQPPLPLPGTCPWTLAGLLGED